MTQKIHSKLYPQMLLVSVLSTNSAESRVDAAGTEEILQASLLRLPQGKTINPHKHLPQFRNTQGTCEAWIVISGKLHAQVFDVDNSVAGTVDLSAGDCMVLYRGGHNFTVVSADAVIYEIKNGPYYGAVFDSEKI
jgi:mannose-6-phosphate isomerase-like protein (cupin superfamily)